MSSIIASSTSVIAADGMNNESTVKQPKHHREGKKQMMKKFKKMARHLDLNEVQKEKIKAIFAEAKEQKSGFKEIRLAYKEQVNSLMAAAIFDDKAFADIHQQYQAHFADAALLRVKTKHAMMQVLTEEQREKAATLKGKKENLFR